MTGEIPRKPRAASFLSDEQWQFVVAQPWRFAMHLNMGREGHVYQYRCDGLGMTRSIISPKRHGQKRRRSYVIDGVEGQCASSVAALVILKATGRLAELMAMATVQETAS